VNGFVLDFVRGKSRKRMSYCEKKKELKSGRWIACAAGKQLFFLPCIGSSRFFLC